MPSSTGGSITHGGEGEREQDHRKTPGEPSSYRFGKSEAMMEKKKKNRKDLVGAGPHLGEHEKRREGDHDEKKRDCEYHANRRSRTRAQAGLKADDERIFCAVSKLG